MANTLFLRLEGPLQSWGERARWTVRDSAPEPTKSGIVGLLGCALGLGGDDDLRSLSKAIRVAVRCDRPGTPLVDYHTVVGGVLSAQNRIKINANTHEAETVVSHRTYLSDASFLVAVRCDDGELVQRLASALKSPHWPIFLGRKCCVPSLPPLEGTGDFESLEAALEARPARVAGATGETVRLRGVIECEPRSGVRRRDEVISRAQRTFGPRWTRDTIIAVPVDKGGEP